MMNKLFLRTRNSAFQTLAQSNYGSLFNTHTHNITTTNTHSVRYYAKKNSKQLNLLILMGPPGAGKGTQARLLQDFSIVGAGDTLREEAQHNEEIKNLLSSGELVSEDQMAELLAKKVVTLISRPESTEEVEHEQSDVPLLDRHHPGISANTKNIIIEGYPRNREQCQKLMELFTSDNAPFQQKSSIVIHLLCDKENIKNRLKGRLIHNSSGRTYHVEYRPPKNDTTDDVTGEPLTKREDDLSSEAIQKRLETYKNRTLPTIEMLSESGFKVIDIVTSSASIESVHERIAQEINKAFKIKKQEQSPKPSSPPQEQQVEKPVEKEKEQPVETVKEVKEAKNEPGP